jgi:hypothetical protein
LSIAAAANSAAREERAALAAGSICLSHHPQIQGSAAAPDTLARNRFCLQTDLDQATNSFWPRKIRRVLLDPTIQFGHAGGRDPHTY